MSSKLIIAAAGSGKTTYLIKQLEDIPKEQRVLITTFTVGNAEEIRKKLLSEYGFVPVNVTVQTWFSFLLEHWVRPYQSVLYQDKITGMMLVNERSGLKCHSSNGQKIYYGEEDLAHFYFNKAGQIYSDKIAKFGYRVNDESEGFVIKRLALIYKWIFIDEVQDLAGYDLELLQLLIKGSVNVIMVGDPRQVAYQTHPARKNKKYANGKIRDFISEKCRECEIDCESLNTSYRSRKEICELANKLYPEYQGCGYQEQPPTGHDGVFLVRKADVEAYLRRYKAVILRYNSKTNVAGGYPVYNFGEAKGMTFERTLIYPTKQVLQWLKNSANELVVGTRAKFYVALTRARFSVGIVVDDKDLQALSGSFMVYSNC